MYDQYHDDAFIPRLCWHYIVNVGSKNMLAHVLLSLLVFEHGFIQISFVSFEFFTRYLFY